MPSEVDTIFNIRQVYTHLAIAKPWLEALEIYDPHKFRAALAPVPAFQSGAVGAMLDNILQHAFVAAEDPKKSGRMSQYQMHERSLYSHIKNGGMDGTIPIFVEGSTITGPRRIEKVGIDPFSNSNLFTTILMEYAYAQYDPRFLDQFRFLFVAPVTYLVQFWQDKNGQEGIKEVLAHELVSNGWRGDLEKYDDRTPKVGNSRFMPDLFDIKRVKEDVASPEAVNFSSTGARNLDEFIKFRRCEAYVNTQIEAFKFAHILDLIAPQARRIREIYAHEGLQLHMAKTSWCAHAMAAAHQYAKEYVPLEFVGGKLGIHADNDLPLAGICEEKAVGRLFGFFHDVHQLSVQKTELRDDTFQMRSNPIGVSKMRYSSVPPYPEFLLENGTKSNEHAADQKNMHAMIPEVVSQIELALIRRFSYANRVGFCAIEPRIVTLLTEERSMYTGLRKWDKRNARWLAELEGKEIVYPGDIPGLFAEFNAKPLPIDVTGYEFSMPTSIGIDEVLIESAQHEGGVTFTGCGIDRLLSGMHRTSAHSLLDVALASSPTEVKREYWRHHMLDHESINAVRSAAIHRVTLFSDPHFAHNKTLEQANLKPVESHRYVRVPIIAPLSTPHGEIELRAHPDATLLFKHQGSQTDYDILIVETEVNRVSSCPQHRRTLKGFFHGYVVGKALESLGKRIGNIYVAQNTLAFYRGFYGEFSNPLPHSQYREQNFTPVIRFDPASVMHPLMRQAVTQISREKRELTSHDGAFIEEKKRQERHGSCERCFLGKRLLCDSLKKRASEHKPVRQLLEGHSLRAVGEKYTTPLAELDEVDPTNDPEADTTDATAAPEYG